MKLATSPVPSVVRSSVSSWMTASCPSLVRWTSSSIASAPAAAPSRKASIVFSGAWTDAPRCATTSVIGTSPGGTMAGSSGAASGDSSGGGGVPSGTLRTIQKPITISTSSDRIATW